MLKPRGSSRVTELASWGLKCGIAPAIWCMVVLLGEHSLSSDWLKTPLELLGAACLSAVVAGTAVSRIPSLVALLLVPAVAGAVVAVIQGADELSGRYAGDFSFHWLPEHVLFFLLMVTELSFAALVAQALLPGKADRLRWGITAALVTGFWLLMLLGDPPRQGDFISKVLLGVTLPLAGTGWFCAALPPWRLRGPSR